MKDIAVNRKAYHDFAIEDTYEAGMVLLGSEIKSLRKGKVSLKEAYVAFINGEAFVKGMHIASYKDATYNDHDETRDRKLLLHKREIRKILGATTEEGKTVVPLQMYINEKGLAKVDIAIARGKKLYDKRDDMAKKDADRKMERALKSRM